MCGAACRVLCPFRRSLAQRATVSQQTYLLGGNGGGMMMKKAFSQPAVFVVGPLAGNRVIMECECALAGMVRGD